MSLSRTRYVNLLRSQVGYREGRTGGTWNNVQRFSPETPGLEWSQGQAWCATFTAWGADELGARDLWPITASCYTAVQWWKKAGRWTEYPVLGGPFYLGTVGQDHVGVVCAYDADKIYTVEGNTNAGGSYQGDGVYLRVRPRRGPGSPYGYGVPAFFEGAISADPALGGVPAASVPTTNPPAPSPEDDMPTPAEIAAAVWKHMEPNPVAGGAPIRMGAVQRYMDHVHARQNAKVDGLAAKVDALQRPALTPGDVAAIAEQVAASPVLAERIAELVADKFATRLTD